MNSLSVSPKARDINITFEDSCNGCCWCWRIPNETPVYITSQGKAVRFDPQKAYDEREAMKRCMSNLQHKIDAILKANALDQEKSQEIMGRIKNLAPEDSPKLTLGTLDTINEMLAHHISSR